MVLDTQTLTDQIIGWEQAHVVPTYKRPPFVLVHGEGVYLYDTEGKAYLDWVAGIAVNSLGYADAGVESAIHKQLSTGLIHVSNLYHTAPQSELAKMLCELSFADQVFFTNSGTEANEAAIKFARKVAYTQDKLEKHEIVTFTGAFHGRTMGTLALTPREKYQKPFKPLMSGVKVAEFNNIDSAKSMVNANTAAVIVEPVQGEGGVHPANAEFLQALRALCDEHDALLIFDEIQCGVGRTGTLWAYEGFDVTPDILTVAKPLAGGLPIGAVLVTEQVGNAMEAGDHGSTFAGGLVVTAVAREVLSRISQSDFLTHVQEVAEYLVSKLRAIDSPLIQGVRGHGLMVGVDMTINTTQIIQRGYQHGLILVNAGANVLRFVPPLIIEKQHVDIMIERLTTILTEIEVAQ